MHTNSDFLDLRNDILNCPISIHRCDGCLAVEDIVGFSSFKKVLFVSLNPHLHDKEIWATLQKLPNNVKMAMADGLLDIKGKVIGVLSKDIKKTDQKMELEAIEKDSLDGWLEEGAAKTFEKALKSYLSTVICRANKNQFYYRMAKMFKDNLPILAETPIGSVFDTIAGRSIFVELYKYPTHGKREFISEEIARKTKVCLVWLNRQLQHLRPELVVLVGNDAKSWWKKDCRDYYTGKLIEITHFSGANAQWYVLERQTEFQGKLEQIWSHCQQSN